MKQDTKVRLDLLEKVAEILESDLVPEDQFDMREWSCGTCACAIGHAAQTKFFQDLGLRLGTPKFGSRLLPVLINKSGKIISYGWDAISLLFNLPNKDACHLFLATDKYSEGRSKDTKFEVAKRIRDFIRSKQDEVDTKPAGPVLPAGGPGVPGVNEV